MWCGFIVWRLQRGFIMGFGSRIAPPAIRLIKWGVIYLVFELSDDPEHVYTLDFNGAYSPYCSYSPAYGCAIPRQEDFLDLAITAGEKRWHDAHSRAKSQVSGIK